MPVLIGMCAVVYFGYHAIQGEHGVMTLLSLERRIAQAEIEYASAKVEEERLTHHVALLRPQSLDRDMLDEQVRLILNLAHPDDFVVLRDDLHNALP
ncbi:MAG: septum formation initiator family protein [Rhodospirillaceae bacterium]|nr:septum formation initiator family protein [Rhodospirillaceae bacterium]MBT6204541.1 septum formation initiator family protein [Rhodospirillaceae bacterium]MBT6509119.1 septum formation initiator family protein [Rhodospirillaceae bacterium]